MRVSSRILLLILISLFLLTLAGFVSTASAVIYGTDDRIEPDVAPLDLQNIATNSTAALIRTEDVDESDPDNVSIYAPSVQDYFNLCNDERFLDQPSAAFCSGVLIDDDLLLTAGQCIRTQEECVNTRVVFNYRMEDESTLNTITSADVFNCQDIVASTFETIDYAIIRLDRSATPRFAPASVRVEAEAVPEGTGLFVIGHPLGAPTKIEPGGWVRDNRPSQLDYFVSNSDTYAGNSGSGVWRMDTREIVGILVRGESDLVDIGSCYISNYCEDTGCRGEDSTYVSHAIEDLCSLPEDSVVCDNCPDDPDKTEAGICGCGVPDTDSDGDGIADCVDNCPNDYNPGQEDLDGDSVGDVCDDADNDGFTSDEDCDDLDSSINPDACDIKKDGIDQDCDGVDRTTGKPCGPDDGGEPSSKEGPAQTCSDLLDNDGDGDVDCADSDCAKKKHCKNL